MIKSLARKTQIEVTFCIYVFLRCAIGTHLEPRSQDAKREFVEYSVKPAQLAVVRVRAMSANAVGRLINNKKASCPGAFSSEPIIPRLVF